MQWTHARVEQAQPSPRTGTRAGAGEAYPPSMSRSGPADGRLAHVSDVRAGGHPPSLHQVCAVRVAGGAETETGPRGARGRSAGTTDGSAGPRLVPSRPRRRRSCCGLWTWEQRRGR